MNSTHREIRQKGPGTVGLEQHTQRHWVTREKLGKVELAAAEGQATERQISTSSELESSTNRETPMGILGCFHRAGHASRLSHPEGREKGHREKVLKVLSASSRSMTNNP